MYRRLFNSFLLVVLAVACLSVVLPTALQASGGGGGGGGSNTPPPPGTYDVGGTVYVNNLSAGYIVIETQKGCFQAIYPDSNTYITKNGVLASITDILPGNRIRSNNSLTTGHTLVIDARN